MTGVIDVMNYAPFVAPGLSGTEYQYDEFQTMVRTTLRPLLRNGTVTTQWGRVVAVDDPPTDPDPELKLEEAVAQLNATGCEAVVLACLKMYSYRSHHQLIMDLPEEVVAEAVAQEPSRFIGAAGYNPWRIDESLRRIEKFVRECGFKYVYFHPITFGMAPNNRRCYPLYAKCVELGIPVGLQVGHSAEPLPSDVGRPMLVDEVAIDFPDLKINLSHTGWPWTGEFISMLWRHPNVYGDISAYFPKSLDPELVRAMDRQLRHKVMLGTNGFPLAALPTELDELPLRGNEGSDPPRQRRGVSGTLSGDGVAGTQSADSYLNEIPSLTRKLVIAPFSIVTSCRVTSATREVAQALAGGLNKALRAAASQDSELGPTTSVMRYTLSAISSLLRHWGSQFAVAMLSDSVPRRRSRANCTNQSSAPGFASASRLAACLTSRPISRRFTGTSSSLPVSVFGTSGVAITSSGTWRGEQSLRFRARSAGPELVVELGTGRQRDEQEQYVVARSVLAGDVDGERLGDLLERLHRRIHLGRADPDAAANLIVESDRP